jgi:hypothetical protein
VSTLEKRRRAAVRYLKRGTAMTTVPAGEKMPGRSDRQNVRLAPEDVPHYFNDRQNIGLLTGEPSGWSVGVGLGTGEAVEVDGRLLPPTLTGGRESRSFGPRWLRSPGAEGQDRRVASGAKLEGSRTFGRRTIVASSTRPEGDKDDQGDEP